MKKYLTEFIGTFFLVLTIGLAQEPLAPLAIGSALMVMVYMGGHVSGGHYNPAVSLAATLTGKMPILDFLPYVVFQVAGAFVAAYTVFFLKGRTFVPAPGTDVEVMKALLVEGLFTFALALVVLNAATAKKTTGNSFYGLAIGFTVLAGAVAGGPISGGAYNPAVGTGPTIIHALFGGGNYNQLWIYLAGPFAGGVVAALVFWVQEAGD